MSDDVPRLSVEVQPSGQWLLSSLPELLRALPGKILHRQRWFGSKTRAVAEISMRDAALFAEHPPAVLALVDVRFDDGAAETYYLPLSIRPLAEARRFLGEDLTPVMLVLATPGGGHALCDAAVDPELSRLVLAAMREGRTFPGGEGSFTFAAIGAMLDNYSPVSIKKVRGEQSNSSLLCDADYVLKAYRKLQNGPNPDLEVPHFLTTKANFAHTPPLAGLGEYVARDFSAPITALTAFVVNEGDGWAYALKHLQALYDHAEQTAPTGSIAGNGAEATVSAFSASFLREMRRLGEITAELHLALSSVADDPAFAPEPITAGDVDDWLAGMRKQLASARELATAAMRAESSPASLQLGQFAAAENALRARFDGLRNVLDGTPVKIRHHGDFHLGQVLKTSNGFAVLDFEGEPARPLAERRRKHLALRDVAGMLRSFGYAAQAAHIARPGGADTALLEPYGAAWERLAGAAFREGYLLQTHGTAAAFLPASAEGFAAVVEVLALDKAVYELIYELNNRPDWVAIPLRYILRLAA